MGIGVGYISKCRVHPILFPRIHRHGKIFIALSMILCNLSYTFGPYYWSVMHSCMVRLKLGGMSSVEYPIKHFEQVSETIG